MLRTKQTLRLASALTAARQQRYRETGESPNENPTALHGQCPRNAYVLASTLEDFGFSPMIVCGGFAEEPIGPDGIPRSSLPTTIRECRDEGQIHYWVEARTRTVKADLAAEFPDSHPRQGRPLISQSVPSNYYYLEDGLRYTFNPPPR
jgi:hypothetical protein